MEYFKNLTHTPYEVLITTSTDYPTTFIHFLN